MPAQKTRADSLCEYLTGASSDGEEQANPAASFGNYRSSVEALTHGMYIKSPIQGVRIVAASGFNDIGIGTLYAPDEFSLRWQEPGASMPGEVVSFTPDATTTMLVEGFDPSAFLRIRGTPPFVLEQSLVELSELVEGAFAFNKVTNAEASAGSTCYRATILRNDSDSDILAIARWIDELATSQISSANQLSGSGSGQISTSGSFNYWPTSGWCQVRQSDGTLREVVYYTSRTSYTLTVPSAGRGLLGTSATAGANTDTVHSVPGIAIGFDPAGVQNFGAAITTIANENAAPAGVTWNLGISQGGTNTTGLTLVRLRPGFQIGFWLRRHIPAGAVFMPNVHNRLRTTFSV